MFVPLTISWNLTKRCNLACEHCYIEASSRERGESELSSDEALQTLHQLAAVNPEAVLILTGGEPLLRKDIFQLIKKASGLGFYTVLGSHGGLLDESVADKLISSGLKGVGVSLDSLNPDHHNRFRGIAKAWEKTVAAMNVMKSKSLSFLIETTVTPFNRHELQPMAAFALEKGATALNVFFLVPTGRGANLTDLSPSEIEETLKELALIQTQFAGKLLINAKCAPHYRRVLWELDHDSPFVRTFKGGGCPAGTYYCRITPEGNVTPCPYMPLSVGNVRKQTFQEIWAVSPILQEFRSAKLGGRCGACEFTEFCGGCRCRAYAVTGDYLAEDPSCVYQPGTYQNERIPLPAAQTYGAETRVRVMDPRFRGDDNKTTEIHWTEEASSRLKNIPFFARGMVKRSLESKAAAEGISLITEDYMKKIREQMSGKFPIR